MMPDRELLLERLERLAIVLDELMPQCAELVRDALALLKEQESTINELQNAYGYLQKQFFEAQDKLLKEQEAVKPIPYHRNDGTIFKYECRKCRTKIFKMDLFCRHCGRSVKWE